MPDAVTLVGHDEEVRRIHRILAAGRNVIISIDSKLGIRRRRRSWRTVTDAARPVRGGA
jgi:hypothetical protein